MAKNLKRVTPVYEDTTGVCVWRMPDGAFLGDEEGNFLSLAGEIRDPIVESKMLRSAVYWMGEEARLGEPHWLPGARKIDDEEYEEQVDRMNRGEIPDIIDELKQGGVNLQ